MKKLTLITIQLALCLFFSRDAWASREVSNGGGITEQNLVYLAQNFSKLTEAFRNSSKFYANEKEKQYIKELGLKLNSQVSLRFDNQLGLLSEPFSILGIQWWIQTKYLQFYDLDNNLDLSWAEAAALIFDMDQKARLLDHTKSDVDQQFDIILLRQKLYTYFLSQMTYEFINLPGNSLFQSTSVLGNAGQQIEFLIQLDQGLPISLTEWAQKFLECSEKINNPYFFFPRLKSIKISNGIVDLLLGIKLAGHCGSIPSQKNLLIKLQSREGQFIVIDWGSSNSF